jgi:uncharacterized membrane protein YvbJ
MKCPHCGSELKKGDTTCKHCWDEVGKMTPKKAKQGEMMAKARKSCSKVFIFAFVAVVVVIGALIFLATRG